MKLKWEHILETHLVKSIAKYRAGGDSENMAVTKTAEDMGISYGAAYNKYVKIKKNFTPIPDSRYTIAPELTFDGPALALGDMQIPYQHAETINRGVLVAQSLGITNVVLGGDNFEFAALSAWPAGFEKGPKQTVSDAKFQELMELSYTMPEEQGAKLRESLADSTPDTSLSEEIAEVRRTIRLLLENFENIYVMMGNHEHRAIRRIEAAINVDDLGGFFFGDNPKVHITHRYQIQSTCNGKPWRYTHPKPSAKDTSSKKLAPKYSSNVIMFHGHHFSCRTDISGKYMGIEPGMCCDEAKMGYPEDRDTGGDAHINGCAIVNHDGNVILLNDWMGI